MVEAFGKLFWVRKDNWHRQEVVQGSRMWRVGAGDLKLAKEGWLLAYNFARLKLPASKPSKGFCVDESVISSGYALYFLLAGGKPIIKRSVTIIKMCSWLLKKKKKSECF